MAGITDEKQNMFFLSHTGSKEKINNRDEQAESGIGQLTSNISVKLAMAEELKKMGLPPEAIARQLNLTS
jgi:hypothetical protein